jgi:hypothetical protein
VTGEEVLDEATTAATSGVEAPYTIDRHREALLPLSPR